MRRGRLIIFAMLIALAGCVALDHETAPRGVYVMRHLHTPAGVKDPDLTDEGRRTAQRLVRFFGRERPVAIYVSNTKRSQQTADPLARKYKIAPTIYDPADTAGLIVLLSRETGTVLVVAHSNTVPDIIEQLGGQRPAPLAHADFGDIWKLSGPLRVTERFRI